MTARVLKVGLQARRLLSAPPQTGTECKVARVPQHTVNCARPIFTVPLTGYLSCCLLAHCRVCGNATADAELLFGGEGRGKRNIAVPNVASLTYRGAWQPARLHAKSCRREFGQNSQMSEQMGEKAGTFSELACVS